MSYDLKNVLLNASSSELRMAIFLASITARFAASAAWLQAG